MPPPVEDMSDENVVDVPSSVEDDASDEDTGDIPFNAVNSESSKVENDKNEDSSDVNDEGAEEGIYVVEAIVDHFFADEGDLNLLVRWKDYPKIEDHTWEQEPDLLDGAKEAVMEYYVSIGGRPKKPKKSSAPKAGSKRKSMDKESTVSKTEVKKRRRSKKVDEEPISAPLPQDSPEDSDSPDWLPAKGESWEKEVKSVDTITRNSSNGLEVLLLWQNGKRTQVAIERCYEKCPKQMLKFYELHLVFNDITSD